MRTEIVQRQVAEMRARGFDALLSCSPENFTYATGFVVPSQSLIRHRHAMVLITADGACRILGVDMEATTIRKYAGDTPVYIWAEFTDDCMQVLGKMIAEAGLSEARIGTEMDYLPAGDMSRLCAVLPKVRWEPCEGVLARLRQIKTRDEIALLRRLSLISDQAVANAIESVKLGSSEMDIAAALSRNIYTLGAEHFKLMIVATGDRSQLPNVGPSHRRLEREDVCRVEIFGVISGYQAAVCRTAVVQKAPAHADRIWKHLVECKYDIMDMLKPGASCRTIYGRFIEKLKKLDLPPISFVGHGIGLHLHEDPYLGETPNLGKTGDAHLEAGMVLGIEPLCYRTGHGFGMQNKDMFVVTETGCELLSNHTDTDQLLVIQ